MSEDEQAGRWDKEQLRIDDGPGDPRPPRTDEGLDREDEDEVIVAEVVAADPATGDVVAGEVVAAIVDRGGGAGGAADDEDPGEDAPGWNKEQMAIDDDGDADSPRRMDPDAMPESEMGPTGGRANPGGGQRFGEIDDTPPEKRR